MPPLPISRRSSRRAAARPASCPTCRSDRSDGMTALPIAAEGVRPRGAPQRRRTFRILALLPAVVVLVLLTIVPVVNLFAMALSQITFSRGAVSWTFAPMQNLQTLAGDSLFRIATWNTLVFVVVSVSIEMVL